MFSVSKPLEGREKHRQQKSHHDNDFSCFSLRCTTPFCQSASDVNVLHSYAATQELASDLIQPLKEESMHNALIPHS